MGLLSRILKTPNDDADDAEDEFEAEQNGLLMASLPPEEPAEAAQPEARADAPSGATADMTPQAEAAAPTAEGEAEGQPGEEEGKPPQATGDAPSSEPEEQAEPPADEAADDSSDDMLAAFKTKFGQRDRAQAIHDDLVDVPMAELLAEARAIRDALRPAGQVGHLIEEAEEEAA
jgi:hypothetical protein